MEPWPKFRNPVFTGLGLPKGLENQMQCKNAIKSAQSSPNRPGSQSSMQFYIRTHTKFRESQCVYKFAILAPFLNILWGREVCQQPRQCLYLSWRCLSCLRLRSIGAHRFRFSMPKLDLVGVACSNDHSVFEWASYFCHLFLQKFIPAVKIMTFVGMAPRGVLRVQSTRSEWGRPKSLRSRGEGQRGRRTDGSRHCLLGLYSVCAIFCLSVDSYLCNGKGYSAGIAQRSTPQTKQTAHHHNWNFQAYQQ